MSSIPLRGVGQSVHIPNSSTTTSSPKAGTLRPGSNRNFWWTNSVRPSHHSDHSGQRKERKFGDRHRISEVQEIRCPSPNLRNFDSDYSQYVQDIRSCDTYLVFSHA